MRRRYRLKQIVTGIGQSFKSRDQYRHGLWFAAGHDGGNGDVFDRDIFPRRSDLATQHHLGIEWAIAEHPVEAGLCRRNHRQAIPDVLPIEVVHDFFHIAAGFIQTVFLYLNRAGDGQQSVLGGRNDIHFKIDMRHLA